MSILQSIASGLTAATLVAGIGLAYAQSSTPSTEGSTPSSSTAQQSQPMQTPSPGQPSSTVSADPGMQQPSPSGAPAGDSTMSTTTDAPPPRSDRG